MISVSGTSISHLTESEPKLTRYQVSKPHLSAGDSCSGRRSAAPTTLASSFRFWRFSSWRRAFAIGLRECFGREGRIFASDVGTTTAASPLPPPARRARRCTG